MAIPHRARPAFTELVTGDPTGEHPLLLRESTTTTKPQAVASVMLLRATRLLASCGIEGDLTVKPASIRNGAAHAAYENGDVDAAVALLNHNEQFVRAEIGLAGRRPIRRSK